MRYQGFLFLTTLMLLSASDILGQDFIIDLSISAGDTIITEVEPKKDFEIELVNKIPGKVYSVTIKRESKEILPLSLPAEFVDTSDDTLAIGGMARCADLMHLAFQLYDVKDEKELITLMLFVREKLSLVEAQIKTSGKSELGCLTYHVGKVKEILEDTKESLNELEIRRNERLYITVFRVNEDGTKSRWVYLLESPNKGKWSIRYGFTFSANIITQDESYYSKQQDSVFVITKARGNKITDFIPTLFFTWEPGDANTSNWYWTWNAGLGVDSESPVVLAGGGLNYNQNIGLYFGLVAHKQTKLLSIYNNGDIVNDQLTEGQIHESVYRFNPYVSVVFRFDSSPFN